MRKIVYVLPALAALGVLSACSSSTTSSSSSSPSASARSGTEVITASTTNPNATSVTVKASGVSTDTGTFALPGGNGAATVTFKFTHGNLVAKASKSKTTAQHLNTATCAFSQASGGTYTIVPGSSTGTYAGATGHGTFAANFSGILPKTSDGKCNMSNSAIPTKALTTILVRGPLTLKT